MERQEILKKLEKIFRDVFDDDLLGLSERCRRRTLRIGIVCIKLVFW